MSFTQTTVTHKWLNADGTSASGTVVFTLTQRMTNSGVSMVPASKVTATLDGTGAISESLASNVDVSPATTPAGAQWRVDIDVAGCENEHYFITVPPGPGTVDLGTLLPEAQQVQ